MCIEIGLKSQFKNLLHFTNFNPRFVLNFNKLSLFFNQHIKHFYLKLTSQNKYCWRKLFSISKWAKNADLFPLRNFNDFVKLLCYSKVIKKLYHSNCSNVFLTKKTRGYKYKKLYSVKLYTLTKRSGMQNSSTRNCSISRQDWKNREMYHFLKIKTRNKSLW